MNDDDVQRYEDMLKRDREYVHGQLAVEAARIQGILPDDKMNWIVKGEKDIENAPPNIEVTLDCWKNELQQSSFVTDEMNLESHISTSLEPEVCPITNLRDGLEEDVNDRNQISPVDVDKLNEDQRRAYDIVDWHLQDVTEGKIVPQLLMMIPGEGGVGKSKLIQTMTENFERRQKALWCVKGAYTGIAASLIDGKTLHVLGGIPVRGGRQSAQTLKKLHDFWKDKHYLIIDEVSMLSRSFLAKLSQIISIAKESEGDKPFGGLNVILVGDFHQFPPVVGRRSAPLYWPVDSMHDSEDDILGRMIYEQFLTVVQLKEQIRVRDDVWHDVLQHVRYGNCRHEHIDIIKKLVIDNKECPSVDYEKSPWKDVRLITPRHAVRTQWNSAAIRKHCIETCRRLYVFPAEDSICGRPVTNEEKIAIMTQAKGSKANMDRGGLQKEMELAIGAPVMVTLNIMTELDVANGVRGIVEAIVLDERESVIGTGDEHTIKLRYPPRYVLVRLDRTKAPSLKGLSRNVIPIIPVKKTFMINKGSSKITINRTQLPLTLAYAFTDYRSQGQTLQPVMIDIGPPPYGHLTPFNVYVALTRGTGRDNIRLLRDFDETLLQHHPSEFLRLEDERLDRLNKTTRDLWEARKKCIEKIVVSYGP